MDLKPGPPMRQSRSTRCSSAPARTQDRGSAQAAAIAQGPQGQDPGAGSWRAPACQGASRGRGARQGLPRSRLRVARARLLDVRRHERRTGAPGQRIASTSNRNFVGRQGVGMRTHLVSPAMPRPRPSRATRGRPQADGLRSGAWTLHRARGRRRADGPGQHRHRPDHPARFSAKAAKGRATVLPRHAARPDGRQPEGVTSTSLPTRRQIIVAENNFACGSSREDAVTAHGRHRRPVIHRAVLRRHLLQQLLPERLPGDPPAGRARCAHAGRSWTSCRAPRSRSTRQRTVVGPDGKSAASRSIPSARRCC